MSLHKSGMGRLAGCVLAVMALLATGCRDIAAQPAAAASDDPPGEQVAAAGRNTTTAPVELQRFYRDLLRLENGQIDHVTILQLGDSHTAGDFFSGRLRTLFQQRFGDGGRGLMPPGQAFDGLSHRVITVSQNPYWTIENSLRAPELGPYGLTGFVARSKRAGARMTAVPTQGDGFDAASVDFVHLPGGAKFNVLLDGRVAATVSTAGPAGQPGHVALRAPAGTEELAIEAQGPGIGFTGWSVTKKHGVSWESQGVVSATVDLVDKWDQVVIQRELSEMQPSLIVLAYGTNEGFEPNFDASSYEATYESVVARLKRFAPQASVLVIGPPDGQRADPACAARHGPPGSCHWTTPAALPAVRAIQREVARREGTAYWDWSSVMPEGMSNWVERDLGRSDHVHFTVQGYETAAEQLFGRLMELYQSYKSGGGRPTAPAMPASGSALPPPPLPRSGNAVR